MKPAIQGKCCAMYRVSKIMPYTDLTFTKWIKLATRYHLVSSEPALSKLVSLDSGSAVTFGLVLHLLSKSQKLCSVKIDSHHGWHKKYRDILFVPLAFQLNALLLYDFIDYSAWLLQPWCIAQESLSVRTLQEAKNEISERTNKWIEGKWIIFTPLKRTNIIGFILWPRTRPAACNENDKHERDCEAMYNTKHGKENEAKKRINDVQSSNALEV